MVEKEAKELFETTELSKKEIETIFKMADIDKDEKLNPMEFIIAMFLIRVSLSALPLPLFLPPTLLHSALTDDYYDSIILNDEKDTIIDSQQNEVLLLFLFFVNY